MTKEELAKQLGVSLSMVTNNYPLLCQKQALKGILIKKTGHGKTADYTLESIEQQFLDKSIFSQRGSSKDDLPGEIWKETFLNPCYLVSNLGRVKNKINKNIFKGTESNGYCFVVIQGKRIAVHRLVMQTFQPIENFELFTIDHINGKRNDNRLENLKWCSMEENIMAMMMNRTELNVELTRIIQIYGYEGTLTKLKEIK